MNDTKERILEIALQCFIRKPYSEVTMSEILKASGLSKGGFYHHFVSKEALYHEVVDKYVMGTFMAELTSFNNSSESMPFHKFIPAYIKSTLDQLMKLVGSNLEEINLYMIMFDMMKYYQGFSEMLSHFHKHEIEWLTALVDKAKNMGEIRKDIDSVSLASHIHTMMHGISVLAIFDKSIGRIDEEIQHRFDDLYQLIKV